MSNIIEIHVPDIGDFDEVEVIEILVERGDSIAQEDSLITLESDKASMEIPSPTAGTVEEIAIKMGDKVKEGALILTLNVEKASVSEEAEKIAKLAPQTQSFDGDTDIFAEVVVLGSGPGGYTAAFRAADLGKKVIMIEKYPNIGGVCLNVGCIPSKALLHTAQIINEADEMSAHGVTFAKPEIDIKKLVGFKNKVIKQLTGGLAGLAKQRKVQIVKGYGKFLNDKVISVETDKGVKKVGFDNAIIATGSSVTRIPGFPYEDERLIDSTGALELKNIPKRLLIIGGGIIGLEMATVYDALGTKVTIVELSSGLIPGCDRDLVRPLERRVNKRYENIYLNSKVTSIESTKEGLKVGFEGKEAPETDTFDKVLLAVGRNPNGKLIDAEKAGVVVNDRGFIDVNKQQKTNVEHIFAIGDVVGQPMLAHKATHEAKIAAEVISGHKSFFDARAIPSVAYTDPEISWMGMTEIEAKEKGVKYTKGVFPWAASGRSLSLGRNEGMTKVMFDEANGQLIGAGMVGPNAGELIAEAVLALEMGADVEDIALTIHPHPTLSETFNFAAEVAEGTCTDIYLPKKK